MTGPSTPEQPYFSQVPESELQPRRRGRGWGILVGIVATVGLTILPFMLTGWLNSIADSPVVPVVSTLLGLLPLAGLVTAVVLTVMPGTRPFGVGLLMGFGITLIVGAGACVALIVAFTQANA